MDQMLVDTANIPAIISELASETYTDKELQIIRTRSTYSEQMIGKMSKNITLLSMALFRDHPRITKKPPLAELINTFIFRVALCGNLLAQEWISVGGARGVKPERIRKAHPAVPGWSVCSIRVAAPMIGVGRERTLGG